MGLWSPRKTSYTSHANWCLTDLDYIAMYHISAKIIDPDVMQGHPLCRTCFGQYPCRPHQLCWDDWEMKTAISCIECRQVAGLKVMHALLHLACCQVQLLGNKNTGMKNSCMKRQCFWGVSTNFWIRPAIWLHSVHEIAIPSQSPRHSWYWRKHIIHV